MTELMTGLAVGSGLTARLEDQYSVLVPTGPSSGGDPGACGRSVQLTKRDMEMRAPTDHPGGAGCAGGPRREAPTLTLATALGTFTGGGPTSPFPLRGGYRPYS